MTFEYDGLPDNVTFHSDNGMSAAEKPGVYDNAPSAIAAPVVSPPPDLSELLIADEEWVVSVNSPVSTLAELRDAIDDAEDGIPTDIQIANAITYDPSDGAISKAMVNIPRGKIIRLSSFNGLFELDLNGIHDDPQYLVNINIEATLYLRDITLRNGFRGVYNYGTLVMQRDSVITQFNCNNLNGEYGGGIASQYDYWTTEDVIYYSTVIMTDTAQINNCHADSGGGIFAVYGTTLIMKDDTAISDCSGYSSGGGGIWQGGTHWVSGLSVDMPSKYRPQRTFLMDDAQIVRCSGSYGGGLRLVSFDVNNGTADDYYQNELTLSNNANIGDCTGETGGGLCIRNSIVLLEDSALINDNIVSGNGGGIYQRGDSGHMSHLTIKGNADISSNRAGLSGGGIYQSNAYPQLEELILEDSVTIRANVAENNGGGIYISGMGERNLVIDNAANVRINDNEAFNGEGGGIYTEVTPNPHLIIPSGAMFSANYAPTAIENPSQETLDVMKDTVFSSTFSNGFQYVYNNWDINAIEGDPPEEMPPEEHPPEEETPEEEPGNDGVSGRSNPRAYVRLYGRCLCQGDFTVGMFDDGGTLVSKGINDAKGYVSFEPVSITKPGKHCYSMRMLSAKRRGVWLDCMSYTVIGRLDTRTRKTVFSYPAGIPTFMNMGYCC